MNKNSNTYIIAYAAVMVVIVAAVLSFAALSLKGEMCIRDRAADARSDIERPMRVNIYPIGVHVRKND